MIKKFSWFLMLLSTLLIVSACGESAASKDEASKLIVYTNQVSGDREAVFKELVEKQNFEFEVEFVQAGGGDMRDRLIAEKNKPLADVVLGGSPLEYLALVEKGILATHKPSWSSSVDPSLASSEQFYWPWAIDTIHFAYNKNALGGANQPPIPKEWADLTAPEYKDKFYLFGVAGTTGTVAFSSMLVDHQDKNGELGVSDEGWKLIKGLYENAVRPEPKDWQEALKSDLAGGTLWGGGMLAAARDRDIPLAAMTPAAGTPFLPALIGIVDSKDEARIANAKEFVDWWGSKEVQVVWGEKTGQAPANVEALNEIGGEVKNLLEQSKVQELDWDYIYKNIDSWREKILLEYAK
ncbi:extracellular solute-binding protein [Lysinibacillus sp. HST-98]|uniref:extracellular solute-binding protein n=1 Tax=Lysinibacillus sp. HST-98 TaxID=2800419 RepID=UPI0019261767|nr:extracellular solute-binding protein [Lysinibacillus sp. HST-98]MBL3732183.1 extracellular solute-binding protein [Lysinibacillus sp. HST-98]